MKMVVINEISLGPSQASESVVSTDQSQVLHLHQSAIGALANLSPFGTSQRAKSFVLLFLLGGNGRVVGH